MNTPSNRVLRLEAAIAHLIQEVELHYPDVSVDLYRQVLTILGHEIQLSASTEQIAAAFRETARCISRNQEAIRCKTN